MCFKLTKSLGKPSSTREATYGELLAIIKNTFPSLSNDRIYLSDLTGFKLCNLDDINTFLKSDLTDKKKYDYPRYDCDDFAYRLLGQFSIPNWSDLTIGLVWTQDHALNCLIDQNEDFWFIEPQTDDLYKPTDEQPRFIMI